MSNQAIILIPARYNSSRFPGKPLATLGNQSIIERVYENMSKLGHQAFVVTDDRRIQEHLQEKKAAVIRADDDVASGTERIGLAYQRHFKSQGHELVVNVQGDEPLLDGLVVKKLIDFHLNSPFDVATVVCVRHGLEDFENPHVVKVKLDKEGACQDFSRGPLGSPKKWFQHVGIYSYRPQCLERFCSWPPSPREKKERLEQLRGLHNGLAYGAIQCNVRNCPTGIDTPQDLERAREMANGQ